MTKILNFSYNTVVEDSKNVRFAVSRQSLYGARVFVVQTAKSLKKDQKSFNSNLKTNADTLNEVEQVRVKSLEDIQKFQNTVELVNAKIYRHNHSKFKTFLKCLLIPWVVATIFKSDFFKNYSAVDKKYEFSINFSSENPQEFSEVMRKLKENSENIAELDFSNFALSQDNLQELTRALKANTTVHSLILSQPKEGLLTCTDLQLIVRSCPNVNSLSLAGQKLNSESTKALEDTLAKCQIKHLDLSRTNLSAKSIKNALVNNKQLVSLNLSSNALGPESAKTIADIIKANPNLTSLYIGNNAFGSKQIKALANAIKVHPALEIVDIRENKLGDTGCQLFAEALKANMHIKRFDISSNDMGVEAAKAFGLTLENHPSLEHISFFNNKITQTGVEAIAKGIKENKKALQYIDLAENAIERKTYSYNVLKNALAKNSSRRRIRYTTVNKAPPAKAAKPSKLERAAPIIETAAIFMLPIIPRGAITSTVNFVSPHITSEPEDFWETDPGVLRKK